ncbi:DUF2599 domain-containing protein [Dietzia kunjamensis]|uniref:DUF2599 domain-containing protein n=1 Tax=Dietzia kunjamensis TaxID=322509 RepID=UPI0039BD7108
MSHRQPTGSTAAALSTALAALLVAALALGGCLSDPQEPAPGDAGATTSVSTSAARVPTAAPRESPPPPRQSPPPAAGGPAPTERDSPSPVPPFIAAATWADSDYGVTLEVAPTDSGRRAWGAGDAEAAWQEVLRLAPDADTPGMWEQFECHWTWARLLEPDKPTWNVEPWRPVVPPERMLADGCNPGGPEV